MPRSNVIIPSCHYAPEFPRCAKLHQISAFMRARLAHTFFGHMKMGGRRTPTGDGAAVREPLNNIAKLNS